MDSARLIATLTVSAFAAFADPLPGYYDSAIGKTGSDLRKVLHQIIRNHHVVPYDSSSTRDTSDALKVLDRDPLDTNNVVGIYSRASQAASSFGPGWNREHVWPNSHGLDYQEPAYSDLHNLRAEDMNVNSSRGDKYFDVSDLTDGRYRMPAHAEAQLASTDTDSWEPPAAVKGDIARSIFYMAVRYTGDVANEPALYLTDATEQIASTTNLMGRLSTLVRWSHADPVDGSEQLRNEGVYFYQGNRNPFVDHPEWVAAGFVPTLSITHPDNGLALAWANEGLSMIAEQCVVLGATWTVVTNVPSLTASNTWTITVPLEAGVRLFRLRLR